MNPTGEPLHSFRKTTVAAACAVAALSTCSCIGPGHGGAAPLPLDDRGYDQLRRLDAAGLIQSAVVATLPLSRKEAGRYVLEARERGVPERGSVRYDYDQLYAEHLPEILGAEIERGIVAEPFETRLDSTEHLLVSAQGPQHSYNSFGIEDFDGLSYRYRPRIISRVGQKWLVTFRPEISLVEAKGEDEQGGADIRFLEANVRLFTGSFEFEVGADSLWWGPGRHGALLVSNNAAPFRHFWKFGTHEQILLPGWLSKLGPASLVVFGARLDDDQEFRHGRRPWLGGMRLEFRPSPGFSFGMSRTAVTGGEASGEVDADLVWRVFLAENENRPEGDLSDQKAGLDMRWRSANRVLPFEVYAEVEGEDQAGVRPSRLAWLVGAEFPRLGPASCLDLLAEYATTVVDGHDDYWYNHGLFGPYTYQGTVMGHHAGSDADDLFVRLGFTPARGSRFEVAWDRERHGISAPYVDVSGRNIEAVECKDEISVSFIQSWAERKRWSVTARFQEWRNYENAAGRSEHASSVGVEVWQTF